MVFDTRTLERSSEMKSKFNCPAEMTLSLIAGKWKAVLIYNLRKGSKRFGELKRLSPGITAATLAQQLREMEDTGLVARSQIGREKLLGVEYALTERGQSLRPVLNALIRWGLENQREYVIGDFRMDPKNRESVRPRLN